MKWSNKLFLSLTVLVTYAATVFAGAASESATKIEWNPRERFIKSLIKDVPSILKSQDRETGRFGSQPWICSDQNVIFPLAAAWAIEDKANPYYHSPDLLEVIMKGGDALIADQDKKGMWTFRKKDNSTWGQILMPWTYSRWIRAFALIKDGMPAERRQHWEEGLLLGFTNISKSCLGHVHNIPSHHAMALYCAGECFGREDWKQQVRAFMAKIVATQSPGGWWSEHSGPVVAYNFVYIEALGLYYAMSHDASVLEALQRAAVFHATFVYPNGTVVETVDERNPYEAGSAHGNVGFSFTPVEGNVGFSFTPEGRGFLQHQYSLREWSVTADGAASHLLYGQPGPAAQLAADSADQFTIVGNNEALVLRHKPWFICISAFTCEQPTSRWLQDRQNFVSIFHDSVGLIIGGGNTKLQPFWSNFTVGDTALLQHKQGDENPNFKPKADLIHMPSSAKLHADRKSPGLDLTYGEEQCRIIARPLDEKRLTLVCEATSKSGKSVEGHVVFLPRLNADLKTATGKSAKLGKEPIEWTTSDIGEWFDYCGVHISVPSGAKLLWPKKRHNPYKKDGSSTLGEARLVLCLPFSNTTSRHEVTLEITNPNTTKGRNVK
ncbi:MAG: hypothetical protein PHR77_05790 [Kiritimatiellae bacterium]|nr:hypothetical protein [Kiritimatiellia bacterium]MDD5523140.1 hypothetical protein [Kiritimatiellia bacterium]